MAVVGMIFWWYGAGWRQAGRRVAERLAGLMDYFSIDLLIKTLFSPFRQISAGAVDGPITVKLQAFFDKLISRVIGAIVRLIILMVGVIAIIIGAVLGMGYLVMWALMPLLPIAGLIMTLTGWIPWTIL